MTTLYSRGPDIDGLSLWAKNCTLTLLLNFGIVFHVGAKKLQNSVDVCVKPQVMRWRKTYSLL